ncbi:MAG: glycosyltransferase family 4 protein [Halobacteriovoraceae bacterium]|nr:glycosyltransferase family 4 protein [Halobacteriovoraceae bacterium]
MRICHFTSVHPRYDTRVFSKEIKSLQKKFGEVNFIVADGQGDEVVDGIKIYDVGKPNNRKERMFLTTRKVLKKVKSLNCQVAHFHDPELIFAGLKLESEGIKVIYDVHEDLPAQAKTKIWLPYWSRMLISFLTNFIESYAAPHFTKIITATPHIEKRFSKLNSNCLCINNYPIANELFSEISWTNKENAICFVGAISEERGILDLIEALEYLPGTKLYLGGEFDTEELKMKAKNLKGWAQVIELGRISRSKVAEVFSKSKAGIVNFHPTENHVHAMPNKMFEYMSAGLPVICSYFPLWEELVEKQGLGFVCNPQDPSDIAKSIRKILSNDSLSQAMGQKGRHAVLETYNWDNEEKKLIKCYQRFEKQN